MPSQSCSDGYLADQVHPKQTQFTTLQSCLVEDSGLAVTNDARNKFNEMDSETKPTYFTGIIPSVMHGCYSDMMLALRHCI